MANDIRETLIDVLKLVNNMDRHEAEEKIENLREEKRYQEDIFG